MIANAPVPVWIWLALAGALFATPATRGASRRARRLPGRPHDGDAAGGGLALALDLLAAALRAGQPPVAALELVIPAAPPVAARQLRRVAGLLRLGADADEAWRVVGEHSPLAPLATAARRSTASGSRLAATLESVAAEERARVRGEAQVRARRAGVHAIAPLGLCFLPAFVCLGVIPLVTGIARGVLPGLPR